MGMKTGSFQTSALVPTVNTAKDNLYNEKMLPNLPRINEDSANETKRNGTNIEVELLDMRRSIEELHSKLSTLGKDYRAKTDSSTKTTFKDHVNVLSDKYSDLQNENESLCRINELLEKSNLTFVADQQKYIALIRLLMTKNNALYDEIQSCIEINNTCKKEKEDVQDELKKLHKRMSENEKVWNKDISEKEEILKETTKRYKEVEDIANALKIKLISQEKDPAQQTQSMLNSFQRFIESDESHLHCSICHEILMFATSINCGHIFCHPCIESWTGKKLARKKTCPTCRVQIKTKIR